MTPIQVVGIGLDGAAGLSPSLRLLIEQATVLAGSDRHFNYFPDHPAQRWLLDTLEARLQAHLQQPDPGLVVVLTSGDPLFFGLGRQLLQTISAEAITFHPHPSAIQLAFSRVKVPWQDATLISAHGRSLDRLEQCLRAGDDPIAVLTDTVNSPGAIARFIQTLGLPTAYELWVCENLGGVDERVQVVSLSAAQKTVFSPLNVVILRQLATPPALTTLPLLGISDQAFLSFRDRPGLMTKREVRILILGELALQPSQIFWDVGAGTGSVSIEVARLAPQSQIWAIEKTAAGSHLIRQNARRFAALHINIVRGKAPEALTGLPSPDRVFIGGSSGQLQGILDECTRRLLPGGRIVLALTTLENLAEITQWLNQQTQWQGHFQQVSLARSAAVGPLTRWTPLNPVTLVCLTRKT